MALYALSDPHLSFGVSKPMDVFKGWENYEKLIEENWRRMVCDTDTVVIPGDLSWGIDLVEARDDLKFIDSLPGKKIILKGNHDLWWPTKSKLISFFENENITTITPLLHDATIVEGKVICGTRGWFVEDEKTDEKVYRREAMRLEMALTEAKKLSDDSPIVFLHYPPLSYTFECDEFTSLLKQYGVKYCYYGHVHGPSIPFAFNGMKDGVNYKLVSADALGFKPYRFA